MKRKRVCVRFGFITLGNKVPSTRFRILPYFSHLESLGHRCHLWMSFPSVYEHIPMLGWRLSSALKRGVRYRQLASAWYLKPDAIYLERGCLNDESIDLDQAFRKATRRLVLDVDDGIFLERPGKIDKLIAMADHCVASNELIAEYVLERQAFLKVPSEVTVIPTAVSMARYVAKPDRLRNKKTIGWIGTIPNMPFLSECAGGLRRLAKDFQFELLIVGPSPEPLQQIDLEGVEVRFEYWKPELEISHLHQMDIGIMPLPSGRAWMNYKAATKLVQYMAIGIPAVASPIGVNSIILNEGKVGFPAATPDDWYRALAQLLEDEQLCKQLGQAGRQLVMKRYSIEANAPILEKILVGS